MSELAHFGAVFIKLFLFTMLGEFALSCVVSEITRVIIEYFRQSTIRDAFLMQKASDIKMNELQQRYPRKE